MRRADALALLVADGLPAPPAEELPKKDGENDTVALPVEVDEWLAETEGVGVFPPTGVPLTLPVAVKTGVRDCRGDLVICTEAEAAAEPLTVLEPRPLVGVTAPVPVAAPTVAVPTGPLVELCRGEAVTSALALRNALGEMPVDSEAESEPAAVSVSESVPELQAEVEMLAVEEQDGEGLAVASAEDVAVSEALGVTEPSTDPVVSAVGVNDVVLQLDALGDDEDSGEVLAEVDGNGDNEREGDGELLLLWVGIRVTESVEDAVRETTALGEFTAEGVEDAVPPLPPAPTRDGLVVVLAVPLQEPLGQWEAVSVTLVLAEAHVLGQMVMETRPEKLAAAEADARPLPVAPPSGLAEALPVPLLAKDALTEPLLLGLGDALACSGEVDAAPLMLRCGEEVTEPVGHPLWEAEGEEEMEGVRHMEMLRRDVTEGSCVALLQKVTESVGVVQDERVLVALGETREVDERLLDNVGVEVTQGALEREVEGEGETEGLWKDVPLMLELSDARQDALEDSEAVTVALMHALREADSVSRGVWEELALKEVHTVLERVRVGEVEPDCVGEGSRDPLVEGESKPEALPVPLASGEALRSTEAVSLGVTEAVPHEVLKPESVPDAQLDELGEEETLID